MTLAQRRKVVRRFMAGSSIHGILDSVFQSGSLKPRNVWHGPVNIDVEQVLRDYLLGKFTLKAKRKVKR